MASLVPVLEIGGTHVSSAVVNPRDWSVRAAHRYPLDSGGTADAILAAIVTAGARLPVEPDVTWAVAMPDPFDYDTGIARFAGVGKFEAIAGVDVGAVLRERLPARPAQVQFLNDADAFILGEWARGAASGRRRCAGITFGTGLGTGWLVDGRIRYDEPGVPALGRARTLLLDGAGLEETMSRRALRHAYAALTGEDIDIEAMAQRARLGEAAARATLRHGVRGAGRALGPALQQFGADVVVIGGSMTKSWDLLQPWFLDALCWPGAAPLRLAVDPVHAALRGAACAVDARA